MVEKKVIRIGLGSFDLVKGIAILLVIIMHALQEHPGGGAFSFPLLGFLVSGMMPMFFIISGYGFKKKPAMKMLKKTFSELVVPYLVTIPIAIFFYFVLHWKLYDNLAHTLMNTWKQIVGFLLGTTTGPLWFFLAMFIAHNLLNFILNVKNELVQALMVGLCVATGFAIMQLSFVMQFDSRCFRIVGGLTAVGFCYIGYILKEKKILGKAMYSAWTYIFLFFIIWMLRLLGMVNDGTVFDMASAHFSLGGYLGAGCIGLLLVVLGLMLNQIEWTWLNLVRKCGMYSYWILIVHTIDYIAFPWNLLWQESISACFTFVIEVGLRILIITTGCDIIKKITQVRYKNKIEKRAKTKQCVVAKLPE